MAKNTEKGTDKRLKNLRPPWPKGTSGNPDGYPKGEKNFATKWRIFIDKVAKQNNITSDEVDEQMLAVAFKAIKNSDFRFYKDTMDRLHGTAIQKTDITSGGKTISDLIDEISK